MSVVTPHQTDLTTFCKFKRGPRSQRALHLLLNHKKDQPGKRVRQEKLAVTTRFRQVLRHNPRGRQLLRSEHAGSR